MEFASGNLEAKINQSDKNDELDGIIGGLNMLGEELRASTVSRDFLDNILRTMIDSLVIVDMDLMIVDVNPALELLLGYEAAELVGRPVYEIYGHDKTFLKSLSKNLPDHGYFAGVETSCLSKGNIEIPVSVSISAIQSSEGPIQNFIFINHDISERKRRETEILSANQKMKAILDALPDLLFEIDLEGNFYNYHTPRSEVLELPPIDFQDKKLSDVLPHDIVSLIMSSVQAADDNGWSTGTQFELRLPKGKFWFEISVNRMVTNPGPANKSHFIVLARNITQRKRIELQLLRSMDLLNEAQELGRLGSWELDLTNNILTWSNETYRIFELNKIKFTPSYENFLNVIHPDDREKVNQAYARSLETRQPYDIVHRLLFTNGRIKWVHEHCSSIFDEMGKPLRSVGAVQDITEQMLIEEELRIAAVTFETHEGILITDANAGILRVNQAFQDITGFFAEEVIGKNPRIMSSGKHDRSFYADMWKQLKETGTWGGEIWDKRKNGQIYPKWLTITAIKNKEQNVTQYVGIFNDISVRKKAEEEIRNLAFYDALTNIPNRRLLLDRFRLAISLSARSRQYGAVLYLDMDKFKNLNDIMGHEYGDILLIEVAKRIQSSLRDVDTVARIGGDEFVVLIEEISGDQKQALQKVALIAEKIRTALTVPYQLGEYEYYSSSSIGICLYCGNEKSVVDLLKSSDMAMYQAKESGRNTIRFFDPLMQQAVENHAVLESNLRTAITNNQLQLHYQIQVDNDARPLGAEGLVRWEDPKLGSISPTQFIHIAEESTLILDIGRWVIDTACRQLAVWGSNEKYRHFTLSVNVSARQFGLPIFVDIVTAALNTYKIDPSRLKLELTEHVLLHDVTNVVSKMHALKALGVWLSIDDFGTGYSSLSYLKQLPIHQLKIDQSFVRDIATDPNDAMMVKTIISLAQNFHLDVIAEGVETTAQMEFLKQNGCMAYQGYLYSKPVPIEEFEKLIESLV